MKYVFLALAALSFSTINAQYYSHDMEEGQEMPTDYEIEVVEKPEKNAEFAGGMDAMYDYLTTNLMYPEEMADSEEEGKVLISFVVDEEGNIRNVTVVHGVNEAFDNEAIRVVSDMPKWIPAENDGRPVATAFTLPILFQIPQE